MIPLTSLQYMQEKPVLRFFASDACKTDLSVV